MTIQPEKLYDADYNLWLLTTAKLLRERQLDQIDYKNLIEDLEAMVRSDKNALASNLRILLMHLLKWKYQPDKRTNSWKYTIFEHCLRINESIEDSPSLRPYFDEIFDKCYQKSRTMASIESALPMKTFPVDCPFTKQDVLNSEKWFTDGDD